ncbi:MAG: hypothetical protein BGO14_02270 [Chlamydiales bacterium 38-26]|nr:hypothetical protein [Chlamydiales bacterium]OJV08264.1 MAG: hypothetical protein BGO14_02270 [Chlamydiales bacterium 38-26]
MSSPQIISSTSFTTNTGYVISPEAQNDLQQASAANVGLVSGRHVIVLGTAQTGAGGAAYILPLRNIEGTHLDLKSQKVIKIVTGRNFDSFGSSVAAGALKDQETCVIVGAEFSPGGSPVGQTYAIPLSEIFKSNGTLDLSQLSPTSFVKFVGDNTNSSTVRNGHSSTFMINENQAPSLIMGEQLKTTVIHGGDWLQGQTTIPLKALTDPQKIQVIFNPNSSMNSGNIVEVGDLGVGHPGIIMSTANGTYYIPQTPSTTPINLATFTDPFLLINTQGAIAVGDVNKDWKTDLIIANEKGQVYVIFGGDHLKNGTLDVTQLTAETGFMLNFPTNNPKSVTTFKYSNEGDDLVIGDSASDAVYVYYANPDISTLNGTNPIAENNNNITFYGTTKTGETVKGLDGGLFIAGPNEGYILYTPTFANTPESISSPTVSTPKGNSALSSSASKMSSPLSFLKTTFNVAGMIVGKLFTDYQMQQTQKQVMQRGHLSAELHARQIPINIDVEKAIASEFAKEYRVSPSSVLEIIHNQDLQVMCHSPSKDCHVQFNETTQNLLNHLIKETRRKEALIGETNPNLTQMVHSTLLLGNFALQLWNKFKSSSNKEQNANTSISLLAPERREFWKNQYLPLLEAIEKDLLAQNLLKDELRFYINETKERFKSLESTEDLKDALFTVNYLRNATKKV